MYIEPSSTIKFLANCPLCPDYENTIYFSREVDQQNYFAGLAKYTLSNQSYVRRGTGRIMVELSVEELYNCNYLMFQNTAFSLKWFYAFIKEINYVNNECSEVVFSIDVLQTWFFDYELEDCFVEREHSATDNIGDNIVDEGIAVGDYLMDNEPDDVNLRYTEISIVIASTFNRALADSSGTVYNGTYSGLNYNIYDRTDYTTVNDLLDEVASAGKQDGIVSIFMCPTELCTSINHDEAKTKTVTVPINNKALGAYTPKNNKMYCYPYNYLFISNNAGSSNAYKYELFYGNKNNVQFVIEANLSPTAQAQIAPVRYKGSIVNYNEKLVCDVTTQCAYATDAYKAWLAQRKINWLGGLANTVAGGVTGAILGGVTSAVVGGVGSAVSQIISGAAQNYAAQIAPNNIGGTQDSGLNIATASVGFECYYVYPTPEYCRIIDDYFSITTIIFTNIPQFGGIPTQYYSPPSAAPISPAKSDLYSHQISSPNILLI